MEKMAKVVTCITSYTQKDSLDLDKVWLDELGLKQNLPKHSFFFFSLFVHQNF